MAPQLEAFAPRRVIEHRLLHTGGSWTESATTLFVDLEGFTPLTERLGAFGSRGTEELSGLLGTFFAAVTDAVTDRGGDPVTFGGDALMVLFEGSAGPALEAATSAAAAIDVLVEKVSGVTTMGGPLRLRARIGIARGEVTTGLVRASRRCLPVQLGTGLDLAVAAESAAAPGTVAVHPSARDVLPDPPGALAVRPGVDTEPAGYAQLTSPWLVDRMASGATPPETHRRITTAFGRFPPVEPAGMPGFLAAIADLLELVDSWEGEVVQVSGGDKGVVAMVVFGTPLAHADDPIRAVEAMLRLQDREPVLAAGVATGPVFAALLGSRTRMFPTLTGLAVTTAARLMQLAGPGDILADSATWSETAGRLQQRGEPSVHLLKGHRDGVGVHLVDGWGHARPRLVAEARPPLVGRRAEVEVVEALLDAAAAGQGRCVTAYGEPGIGKTRLLQEAIDRAQTRDFLTAVTDVNTHPRGRPQSMWRDLLGALIGVPDVGDAATWRDALAARLADTNAQVGLLSPLLGLPLGDPAPAGRLDPALETELAEGLLAQLLAVASRARPALVAVDNVDRLDDGTRAFLHAVMNRVDDSSTSMLLTAVHTAPDEADTHRLLELRPEEAALVAADAWRESGAGSPPPWLHRIVAPRAGGNPLYIRTVVRALPEQWQPGYPPPNLGSGSEGALTALLNERVDRLSGGERELIHLLAAADRSCLVEVLADAASEIEDVGALREIAARLAGQRLVEIADADGVERIRLAHDVLRQAVHASLSHAERDRLHRQLVDSLDSRGADPLEIAYHVGELDDPDLRRRWYPLAGASARREWNFPEAVRYLELARPLLTGAERDRVDVELLEVLLVAGRAEDVLAEADARSPDVGGLLAVRRLLAIAEAAFVCGDFRRCEAGVRRVMDLTDGRDELRHQRAAELLVLVLCETGDTRGAVAVGERMVARAVAAREIRAATTAHAALGAALLLSDRPAQAAAHYRKALVGAEESGDLVTRIHVLSDLAGCAFETAAYRECAQLLADARALADGIGYRRHLIFNLNNEAQLRAVLGDPYAPACAAAAARGSVELGDLSNAANALHTWLTSSAELAASVDHWARLARLDAALDRTLAASEDRAELSVVAARAGRQEEALGAVAAVEAATGELDVARVLRRARLGRLLAERRTEALTTETFLAALDELSGEDMDDRERAEIAVERWSTTRTEVDRVSAVALATRALGAEPSAVVRRWFDELGQQTPEAPSVLPPPVGIGGADTSRAQLDEAFTLVEAALRARQRSE